MTQSERQFRLLMILAFGLVYLFWGSTYLAIRIAVEHIPPALMCGTRFLISGTLMLAYCGLSGHRIRYSPLKIAQMSAVGILLLVGGNLTLSYAERYVPSGLAALVLASIPLFFLILDTLLLGDHHISARGLAGLFLGLVGIVVLLWPKIQAASAFERKQLWACLALLCGAISWALGSILSKRWQSSEVDQLSASGWQMLAAGVGNLIVGFGVEDYSHVVWTHRGIGAICYLVICGSLIGYTAYIWLLANAPTSKVATYAYVNPVVAVFLGWLILHERVDSYILFGTAIVVASVILVTSAKVNPKATTQDLPELEVTSR